MTGIFCWSPSGTAEPAFRGDAVKRHRHRDRRGSSSATAPLLRTFADARLSADGGTLLTATATGEILLWPTAHGAQARRLAGMEGPGVSYGTAPATNTLSPFR